MSLARDWRTAAPTLLSINNYFYRRGGAEVVFLEQNKLFQDIGWNVAPFSMQHPENPVTNWAEFFITEIEFGRHYSVWERLAIANKIVFSFEARKKLDRLIHTVNPDIAHLHNIYHHISPSILGLLNKRGVPVVLTLHDLKLLCPAYKMLTHDGICERCKPHKFHNVIKHKCIKNSLGLSTLVYVESILHFLLRSYASNVCKFIVPSQFYLEKMVEWGWNRDRFVYVPNFVDPSQFQPEFRPGNHFLYFGRLSSEKGLDTLINAAAAANASVIIVGAGPDKEKLERLANTLNANISFAGYRSGDELFTLIRNARAVVLPSQWFENAPLSVLESYALGKPIVGARIGGIPELIRDGETGMTFESGSVEELVVVLERLQDMPDSNLESMGRSAREWAETEFTPEKYVERLLSIYRGLGVDVSTIGKTLNSG